MPSHRSKLMQAIDAAREAAKGPFTAEDVARVALEALTPEDCWNLALDYVTVAARRRIRRAMLAADPRQGWLALPEYEHVPQIIEIGGKFQDVNDATLEEYRQAEAKLEARIKSYDYPRRAEQRLKRDQKALEQMRKLDRQVAPLMAGDPSMKIRQGIAAFERLGGRAIEARRSRASKGGKAKSRATKNQ